MPPLRRGCFRQSPENEAFCDVLVYSISQLEVAPKAVVFFNSGVKLTLQDANTLADIQAMAQRGTIIRVCGTCADYFQVKDQVAVGEICNMYDIVDLMSNAAKVINI